MKSSIDAYKHLFTLVLELTIIRSLEKPMPTHPSVLALTVKVTSRESLDTVQSVLQLTPLGLKLPVQAIYIHKDSIGVGRMTFAKPIGSACSVAYWLHEVES